MKTDNIPLCKIHDDYWDEELEAIKEVLMSGRFVKGPRARELAKSFAEYLNDDVRVQACSSGTAALYAIAVQLKKKYYKCRVVIPALSFWATAQAFMNAGCDVQVADVDEKTLLMGPYSKKEVKVLVHLYGNICDPSEHDAYTIVEDACQAHGAMTVEDDMAGTLGDYAAFSLFPSKNMTSYGEGGLIVAKEDNEWRDDIIDNGRHSKMRGLNLRMSEIHAALAELSLKKLDANVEQRAKLASIYDNHLPNSMKIETSKITSRHARHLYVIKMESKRERADMIDYLRANGIETGIHYPYTLNELRGLEQYECPIAEDACRRILSLPLSPLHTEEEIKRVCEFF